jgi:flagellar hook-basal body complex protein FliE
MNFLNVISQVSDVQNKSDVKNKTADSGEEFLSILKDTINEVNQEQEKAEIASASIATGSVKDLHQAAIAIDKAEISMKMMLEVRNKVLNAYKDILRTQV